MESKATMGRWRKKDFEESREAPDEPVVVRCFEPLFAEPASPWTREQIEATERSFKYDKRGRRGWTKLQREKSRRERLDFFEEQQAKPREQRIGKCKMTGDFSKEEIAEMERLYGKKGNGK